jgi:hypothetical protein
MSAGIFYELNWMHAVEFVINDYVCGAVESVRNNYVRYSVCEKE